jgi:hypothetical protein
MRKLMMILALATVYVAVSHAGGPPPPECDPNCPWIR